MKTIYSNGLSVMKFLFVTLLTFSVFMESMTEHFKVEGPAAQLEVAAGSDLILPCSLQPKVSAVDMMVKWLRQDLTGLNKLVHLYNFNEDRNEEQILSYRGRTSLFKEELHKGNTSLKLSTVQPSDEGEYKCFVKSQSNYDDISVFVRVFVNLKVVGPAAPLVVDSGADLVLPCSLQPSISAVEMMVEWSRLYETDTLVHLYVDNEDRNEAQIQSYRGRTALFKTELEKGNTSLKLSAVQSADEGEYKCFIQSGARYDDITVHVVVKGNGLHAGQIALISLTVFGVLIMSFTVCILKDKFSKKQLSPLQCSAVSYMHLMPENVRSEWNLKKYNTSEEGYRRLFPAITNCRKALLDGCSLTKQSTEALAAALQLEHTSLKHLDLSNNDLRDLGLEKLSDGLKSPYCTVEVVRLARCKLGPESCTSLQSVLQSENCPLRELDLSSNELENSGVKSLSEGLKSAHCKLKILRLFNCNFGQQSCENLRSVLQSENCPLIELDLSNNDLQDSGVKLLSDGLKSSYCKLEILRLYNCNLGQKTCENLGSVLQSANCPLVKLDLSNNDLQDAGVKLLSDGLRSSHCKLEILRLSGCLVTEEGCSSLQLALSSNPSCLKTLDLTYNHPGDSGVKLLSALLEDPNCKLHTLSLEYAGSIRLKPGLRKYACELTLDPNTAHTNLSLTEGDRRAKRVEGEQSYPDHPERFDAWGQVLCREALTGRCYWEAEWSGGAADFAVAYRSIHRKGSSGDCMFGRNINSWSLYCSNNNYNAWHNSNETIIPAPTSISNRIGVYLDWPAGTLTFYSISDTDALTHLHTFHSTFTKPLYAGIWVGYDSSVCVSQIK